MSDILVLPVKDEESELPVPAAWRPTIKAIVKAFVGGDFRVSSGVPGLVPISSETAAQVQQYIESYGVSLAELPDDTWDTSVCIWMGNRWDVLIDLWSEEEGRSDLVLSLQVSESEAVFQFKVYMVYVP
jgi:hypothetical protein